MSTLDTKAMRALMEQATPITDFVKLERYAYGGGRLHQDGPAGKRDLIADFYKEGDRECFYALRIAAPALLDAADERDLALDVLDQFGRTNSTLSGACAEAMQFYNGQRVELARVESERDTLRARVAELERGDIKWAETCNDLRASVATLEAEVERLREALGHWRKREDQMRASLASPAKEGGGA